ncbi:UDP-N-acetylglucosamine 2-epimerase (non-hydrolyzing) [Candidatus Pelagibacter sp.]|nr:UDP-N-acetylglucosamine 2-epimerase (non-hydrolyzing) [Candidatus Pelagibacter sp.]
MTKKIKLVTVVGTRPEVIRLSRTINFLDKNIDHVLVHTGQNYNYELNQIFFKDLNLKKPKYNIKTKGKSAINIISQILSEVEKILIKEKPDAFLILGDTNSCLSAYCAKRLKIPIFHIEAGNRCYDLRVPEEINRKIIDHLADINITYSQVAKENLIRESISSDKVFKIGSPLDEVYEYYKDKINSSNILKKLKLQKESYYLLSVHREENIENKNNFKKFENFLDFLDKKTKVKRIVLSTHPRTLKKLKLLKNKKFKKIIFARPFSYTDYSNLQINSKLVLSDSGSITEESSILNFKAINLRNTNERQEGMSYGIAPMAHFDIGKINYLTKYLLKTKQFGKSVEDYKCKDFSRVFFNILVSYIDYVKEYTWKRY